MENNEKVDDLNSKLIDLELAKSDNQNSKVRKYLPAAVLLVSFYSYIRCSRYNGVIPMEPAFVVYLSVIVLTIFDFIKSLKNDSKPVEE